LYARGEQPPRPIDATAALSVPAGWADIVNGFDCVAYVTDHRWNVLAHNQAWADMFPGGRPPRNVMRWMLCDPAAPHTLTGWDTYWAPAVASQLRAACAALPYDDGLTQLEADVLANPTAAAAYASVGDLRISPDGARRPFNHAQHGPGWVDIYAATVGPTPLVGARLMFVRFHPGDQPPTPPEAELRAPDPLLDRERQPPMAVGLPGRRRPDGR
jgi:hypothetical protein